MGHLYCCCSWRLAQFSNQVPVQHMFGTGGVRATDGFCLPCLRGFLAAPWQYNFRIGRVHRQVARNVVYLTLNGHPAAVFPVVHFHFFDAVLARGGFLSWRYIRRLWRWLAMAGEPESGHSQPENCRGYDEQITTIFWLAMPMKK